MNNKEMLAVVLLAAFAAGLFGWMFTAPYLGNEGLARTPGIIIGGTPTAPPNDFTTLTPPPPYPLMMKQGGFPPFVTYLSWVGTEDGIITATQPDGAYWAQRVRDQGGEGWLRVGDSTYEMEAVEIFGEERIEMMTQWGNAIGLTLDDPLYEGSALLRDFEVFYWKPI